MKEQKKVTKNDMVKELRYLLRKNVVGLSQINGEGNIQFWLPNGQIFQISIKEEEKTV